MNEDNKIRSITWIAVSLIVIALWFTIVFATCGCTPTKLITQSTKEYKEARLISAEIKLIESVQRADSKGYYYYISRIYWEATDNQKWFTYSEYPCPYWVGYRIPLLTKR